MMNKPPIQIRYNHTYSDIHAKGYKPPRMEGFWINVDLPLCVKERGVADTLVVEAVREIESALEKLGYEVESEERTAGWKSINDFDTLTNRR